jgi:hypothetical protein
MSTFTPEQIEEMKEAFKMFDKDGGGTISLAEIRMIMNQRGEKVSETELNELMKAIDEDGSGEIDFSTPFVFSSPPPFLCSPSVQVFCVLYFNYVSSDSASSPTLLWSLSGCLSGLLSLLRRCALIFPPPSPPLCLII